MNREDIIRMAREAGEKATSMPDQIERMIMAAYAAGVAAEREACANLVWTTPDSDDDYVTPRQVIADAIRARGQE